MLPLGVRTSKSKEGKKHSKQFRKKRPKARTVANLTLDQQITCFAEIIVNQLLKDLNYETE